MRYLLTPEEAAKRCAAKGRHLYYASRTAETCRCGGTRKYRPRFASIEAAFEALVDRSGYCWAWRGSMAGDGYGVICAEGRLVYAHRYAWERENGPIPEGLSVLHRCDNPPCCNRSHLFLGTTADNSRDAQLKGRTLEREKNPTSRLTSEAVVEIRRMYLTGNYSQEDLGAAYGVSRAAILKIIRGRTWGEYPGMEFAARIAKRNQSKGKGR